MRYSGWELEHQAQRGHDLVTPKESAVKTSLALLMSMCALILASCAGIESRQPLHTVASVDLARYAGTWYEIARLPMWFQRHCIDSKATYTIRPDNKIGVHNECVTDTGGLDQVDGIATIVDTQTNAKLAVTFDNFFARLVGPSRDGNYWILDLDLDYQTALVGTPDRRYLWMLSRNPHLDDVTYQRVVGKAQQLGFPASDLIRAKRRSPM
ncbi:MAG: lipocalin family protein [Nitrospira sp.]|nr:lipocalin family protein [Nitrospira sp.]